MKLIEDNYWHFIIGGEFWKNSINKNVSDLMNYFIAATNEQTKDYSLTEENICRT